MVWLFINNRQKVLPHKVQDRIKHILYVEDAEELLSINKIKDALHVVIQEQKLECTQAGAQKQEEEEVKDSEEWNT